MRRLAAAVLLTVSAAAFAQTPPPPVPAGNISVEAVEVIRQKPDTARVVMKVEVRNAEANVATDEAADEAKKMADGLNKLKLTGVSVAALPQRTVRTETVIRGGVPGAVEYRVAKPIAVTVSEADFDKFTATLEKLQVEAFKLGLQPDLTGDSFSYNPGGQQEKNSPFRVTYSRKGGWEELTKPALEKATKRARAKAEALAAGAGVTLGGVLSLSELSGSVSYSGRYDGAPAVAADPEDTLADGELVRQVRVRVVYATK
jgi:uncharacterized protein YggE